MTRSPGVCLAYWLFFAAAAPAATTPPTAQAPQVAAVAGISEESDPARAAIRKGNYPWYDSLKDQVKPVDLRPPRKSPNWLQSLGNAIGRVFDAIGRFFERIGRFLNLPDIGSLGNALPIALIGLGLVLLAILLGLLWKSARWKRGDAEASRRGIGSADRIKLLPGGLAHSPLADPWSAALERRSRGDYSGAVIYLFAHQLIELDRLGMIRLMPGLTGRTYVRNLSDPTVREWVSGTLGLFEQAYYGHKRLSAAMFEPVWRHAQSFQAYLASRERGKP